MSFRGNPRQVEGLEFQDVGDDVLVHDPHSRKIHVLNRTAAAVLRRCNGASVGTLVDVVAANHPDQRAQIERDVTSVLERFEQLGLITLDA